jgi:hypothetical protein
VRWGFEPNKPHASDIALDPTRRRSCFRLAPQLASQPIEARELEDAPHCYPGNLRRRNRARGDDQVKDGLIVLVDVALVFDGSATQGHAQGG